MATIEDITLREKYKHLEVMFNNTMHTRAQFKQMNKILVNILNHSKGLFEQSKLFSEKLQSFSFTSDSKEPDPLITICGVQYLRFSQVQLSLANQMNDILITPLRDMMKNELNEDVLKDLHRQVNQKRDVYNSCHRTIEKEKKKSKDSNKLSKELKNSKNEFETSIDEFQSKLRDINVSCRFDFIQRLAAFLFANKGCYQQGMTIVDQIGKDLIDIMKDMQDAKAAYIANKDGNNKFLSFVNQMQESGLERQGYLYKLSNKKVPKKKHWNMRWFQLKDGVLSWFSKWKDTQPSGSLVLKLCSVKMVIDKPTTFEITQASPEFRITLRGLTEIDYKEWLQAIKNAISHELSKDESDENSSTNDKLDNHSDTNPLLSQLYEINASNKKCADCGSPNPEWVSINIGSIICIQCSGIHRSLGSHISKVRSLKMDSLRHEVKTYLFNIGNDFVNSIFESNISKSDQSIKPTQDSTESEKAKYIKRKYIRKKFINKNSHLKDNIIEILTRDIIEERHESNEDEIWNCINDFLTPKPSNQNILRKLVYIYFTDLLKPLGDELIIDESEKTLFHALAERGNALLVSFLVLNGHPFSKADSEGRIPLHYAVLSGSLECCQLLANKNFIKLVDHHDKSPLCLAKESKLENSSHILEFFNEFDSSPSKKSSHEQKKKKDKLGKSWTLSGRTKESKPSVVSFFSKRGSDKKSPPPNESIEISRPTTFDGTEQAKTLKIRSRDSISIVDQEILLKSSDNSSSKRVKNFLNRKSLSVPPSPAPSRVKNDSNNHNKLNSNSHVRQESLDTLGSNEFWSAIELKLKNEDKPVKTRLKRSMTMSSEKKLQTIIQSTSMDDNILTENRNRIPSWSKDLTKNLLLPIEIKNSDQTKEKEPKSCPAKVLPPFRPEPISNEDKEILKIKASTSSPPPEIPPKKQSNLKDN